MSQKSSMLSGSGGGARKATVEDLIFFTRLTEPTPI